MKLALIYGPPAVGKLTVAKELVALTGFKLFHNHATVDLITSIFDRGSESFAKLIWEIRLSVFEEAARANIGGLVFTMVYATSRVPRIMQCVEAVERHGGEAHLVRLHCDRATLEQRVSSGTRKEHGKITSVQTLNEFLSRLEKHEPFSCLPGRDNLSIDTSVLEPRDAALKIADHYRLPAAPQ